MSLAPMKLKVRVVKTVICAIRGTRARYSVNGRPGSRRRFHGLAVHRTRGTGRFHPECKQPVSTAPGEGRAVIGTRPAVAKIGSSHVNGEQAAFLSGSGNKPILLQTDKTFTGPPGTREQGRFGPLSSTGVWHNALYKEALRSPSRLADVPSISRRAVNWRSKTAASDALWQAADLRSIPTGLHCRTTSFPQAVTSTDLEQAARYCRAAKKGILRKSAMMPCLTPIGPTEPAAPWSRRRKRIQRIRQHDFHSPNRRTPSPEHYPC